MRVILSDLTRLLQNHRRHYNPLHRLLPIDLQPSDFQNNITFYSADILYNWQQQTFKLVNSDFVKGSPEALFLVYFSSQSGSSTPRYYIFYLFLTLASFLSPEQFPLYETPKTTKMITPITTGFWHSLLHCLRSAVLVLTFKNQSFWNL